MDELGIPLDTAELALVRRRFHVQSFGEQLQTYGLQHPENYAGAYIDSANRLVVKLLNTALADQVRSLVPLSSSEMLFETAPARLDDLLTTADRIAADSAAGLLSYPVGSVGVLQRTSEVLVQSTVNSSQVLSDLRTRYGPRVMLVEGAMTEAAVPPSRRAVPGVKIKYRYGKFQTDTDPDVPNGCTLGHNTYTRFQGRITNFALTAAHCSSDAPQRPIDWHFGSSPHQDIGREVSYDSGLDVALITVQTRARSDRLIVGFNGKTRSARVKGTAFPPAQDSTACYTGATTFQKEGRSICGTVVDVSRTKATMHIRHSPECASKSAAEDRAYSDAKYGGDSGGPVFAKRRADELGVYAHGVVIKAGCVETDKEFVQFSLMRPVLNLFSVETWCRSYGAQAPGCVR